MTMLWICAGSLMAIVIYRARNSAHTDFDTVIATSVVHHRNLIATRLVESLLHSAPDRHAPDLPAVEQPDHFVLAAARFETQLGRRTVAGAAYRFPIADTDDFQAGFRSGCAAARR